MKRKDFLKTLGVSFTFYEYELTRIKKHFG